VGGDDGRMVCVFVLGRKGLHRRRLAWLQLSLSPSTSCLASSELTDTSCSCGMECTMEQITKNPISRINLSGRLRRPRSVSASKNVSDWEIL